jgi:hypothetical protein
MPESGKHVLFYWKTSGGKDRISAGHWVAKRTEEALEEWDSELCDYDEATDMHWIPEGWYEWGWEMETTASPDGPVTHWMSLPAGPGKEVWDV